MQHARCARCGGTLSHRPVTDDGFRRTCPGAPCAPVHRAGDTQLRSVTDPPASAINCPRSAATRRLGAAILHPKSRGWPQWRQRCPQQQLWRASLHVHRPPQAEECGIDCWATEGVFVREKGGEAGGNCGICGVPANWWQFMALASARETAS